MKKQAMPIVIRNDWMGACTEDKITFSVVHNKKLYDFELNDYDCEFGGYKNLLEIVNNAILPESLFEGMEGPLNSTKIMDIKEFIKITGYKNAMA